MIYRNVTRAIKNSTEITEQTRTVSSNSIAMVLTTSDALYVGYAKPFTTRYFGLATANTNASTFTVQYWDGDAWTAVEDLADQTLGFTQSGFISWQNPGDWEPKEQTPITDVELYWVKITVSANLSAGTAIQCIVNLFCDLALLQSYYPEIATDSRYLPPSRSNFLDQFQAAKDLVVMRLKQKRAIENESQIIDINEVAVAAVHAAAYLILSPIATDDEMRARRDDSYKAFDRELNLTTHSFDVNDSGTVGEEEGDTPTQFRARV